MHGADREAGERVRHGPDAVALGKAPDAEIELQVRALEPRIAAREPAGADAVAGQRSALEEDILHAGEELADRAVRDVVHRDRLCAAERQPHIKMILQIGADPGHVAYNRDAVLLQVFRRPETR